MILFLGFKFGSMSDILPHEAKWDVQYDTQIQNELGFKVRTQTRNHYLLAITKSMTIVIHIGQRQNNSSSYFTSCGKIDCFQALGV